MDCQTDLASPGIGPGGRITVEYEGERVAQGVRTVNVIGAPALVTRPRAGQVDITIGDPVSHRYALDGTELPEGPQLVYDNEGNVVFA